MCEFCMSKTGKGTEIGKDYPIHPCANGDLGVRAQYLDGGIVLYRDRNTASGYFDITTALSVVGASMKKPILSRFPSRKFSKTCIIQLDTVRLFEQKFGANGYNTRIFNPDGQDDIGGGCGQLWYVQKWMKERSASK